MCSSSKELDDLQISSEETTLDTMLSSWKEIDYLEIPLEKIALATNNFAYKNLIYKDAFINVYKGKLSGSGQLGNIIVQRRLDNCVNEQLEDKFWKDLLDTSAVSQTKISVVGYCDKKIIVYEHMGNGSVWKDLSDPTFKWMQRLDMCVELAWRSISMDWELASDMKYRKPYFEMVYIICLGDFMFEVLCEKGGDEHHVTQMAIEYHEKGELEKIVHPHLRRQIHQQSFVIFSKTAYNCVTQARVDIVDIRKELREACQLQKTYEKYKRFDDLEIPFEEIALATDNFGNQNLIYTDGRINIYKGKILSGSGQLGNIVVRLFHWRELLETFHLDAFVVGVCAAKQIIVYEHLGNQRLMKDVSDSTFTWMQRLQTCIDLEDSWRRGRPMSYSEYVFNLCLGDLMFQVICGKKGERPGILTMAIEHYENGELWKIIDPNLRVQMHHLSLTIISITAYKCIKNPGRFYIDRDQLQEAWELQSRHEAYLERFKIEIKDIRSSTNNFAKEYFVGSGTYGTVYKAELDYFDRKSWSVKRGIVAIKSISNEDGQGDQGFLTELNMLSSCDHCNIIPLLGFCLEGSNRILIYGYAFKQSLSEYLESTNDKIILTWANRLQICLDIAHGLDYLHNNTEDKPRMIHRDIKSDNILLGENWNAKIGDFGLSKFHPMNQQASTIKTKVIAGTPFYLDPEYERTGHLKKESDIYSFGVVLFEVLSGRLAYDSTYLAENYNGLPAVARQRFSKGTLKDMVDPQMNEADEFICTLYYGPNEDSLNIFLKIAYRCLAEAQIERPTIKDIIKELQNALNIQENRRDILTKFYFRDIDLGTENFSDNNCIIRGAFGKAYKGKVQYHNELKNVVVMRLFRCNEEEDFSRDMKKHDFLTEHEILMKHRDENIIDLVGYCREGNEKIIVYELASVGTLEMHLSNATLGWVERLKICIDVASALEFLHESVQVMHRDFKSASILLNGDWRARIYDFGLFLAAPLNKKVEDYDINDVFSTPGYCDPSYWGMGFLTKESDIYSLGVVLFEILCGTSTLDNYNNKGQYLDDSVKRYFDEKRLDEIVFKDIKQQIMPHSLTTFQMIADQCLHHRRQKRPTAAEVVVQLKKAVEFQMEHSSAGGMGSYSPVERVPSFVEGRGNDKGVGRGDPHADCSEHTASSNQARLDDIFIDPKSKHDGDDLEGVQDAMEIKLGCLPSANEVFETTHLKRGSASSEPLDYQQDLEAQLKAERARTAELEERVHDEQAQNAELEEGMEAERARNAWLEERMEAEQARTTELEKMMEAERARNAEAERARNAWLEERMEVERARNARLVERMEADQARIAELEERIVTYQAQTTELLERICVLTK